MGDVLAQRYVVLRAQAGEQFIVYDTHALCRLNLQLCQATGEIKVGDVVPSHWSKRKTDGAGAVAEISPPARHTPVSRGVGCASAISDTPTSPDSLDTSEAIGRVQTDV